MRVLEDDEVMAVAGGMIQCEPGSMPLIDYGLCGVDDVLHVLAEWFGWYQWNAC